MTFDEYRSIDAVNWSSLKHLWSGSPLLYKHRLDHGGDKETAAMLMGRAVHLAVYEPDRLPIECAVWTEGDRRGKEWKAFEAANAGKTILKAEEYARCLAIRDAVRACPDVKPLLADGEGEKPIRWTDPETRLPCKARLDWLNMTHRHGPTIVDLKTTASIETRRFSSLAARLGYHLQLAHYRNGVKVAMRADYVRVVIIAVEATAPHDCVLYEYGDGDLRAASDEIAELLLRLKHHRETNVWPGRYPEPQTLPIPPWVYGEGQAEITFEEE